MISGVCIKEKLQVLLSICRSYIESEHQKIATYIVLLHTPWYVNGFNGNLSTWALFQYLIRHVMVRSCKVSEAARFLFRIAWSLWNLTGISAALRPMLLSNFKVILWFELPISWLSRDFTRSYNVLSDIEKGIGYLRLMDCSDANSC